ncbi:FkbM family methyltransferase [Synechococcus sp. CS-1332]|uniref:FkbM family methyltransferase n=1 Tax=Synechococcus sp. CS-1332 TaxID=2847972 RepID=UPI00223B37D2|nr:FkbM family methyltransferase [Synechococcus sp. CS-1332]MCT0209043.1 FkbM family methyltransferase [Synechococcus sp. CS-1332]
MDIPIHDKTTVTMLCAKWLASDGATDAGVHLLGPALPWAFKLLATSGSAGGILKATASQSGEDSIVKYIFSNRGVSRPTYLDIGAHHPLALSNTAMLYATGCRGINVEPNPDLIGEFYMHRPEDVNLQIAITSYCGSIDLLIPASSSTLSTVEPRHLNPGDDVRVVAVRCLTLDALLHEYSYSKGPDFLSLDVEGHDLMILEQFKRLELLPKVVCVETISYSTVGRGLKQTDIFDLMTGLGYFVYADTNINTIFVQRDFWAPSSSGSI